MHIVSRVLSVALFLYGVLFPSRAQDRLPSDSDSIKIIRTQRNLPSVSQPAMLTPPIPPSPQAQAFLRVGENIKTVVSDKGHKVHDVNGNEMIKPAGEVLIHEIVGHAAPTIVGTET